MLSHVVFPPDASSDLQPTASDFLSWNTKTKVACIILQRKQVKRNQLSLD